MIYSSAPNWTGTIGSGGVANGSVTTIPLSSAVGLTNGNYYILTIDRVDANGTSTPAKKEVVAGQLSGTNLVNCTRGVEGTAQAHSAGAVVEMLFTSKHWNDLKDFIENLNTSFLVEHNANGTHSSALVTTFKATGAEVNAGTSDTKIVTPKAIADSLGWVTATDGATITFDLSLGNKHKVVLGGNRTLAVSNVKNGQAFIIKLTQDATGSRTVTWWSGISWADGTTPDLTTTPNKSDVFGFIQTGTDSYDGFIVGVNI